MPAFPNELQLETLLSGMPRFQPIAYYDKHLDVIRVQIQDCSIWEERFDRIMTIYHSNHSLRPDGLNDVVGFAIKGIRHLLEELGMKADGAVVIAELLDKLVKMYPTEATRRVLEFYLEQKRGADTDLPETVEMAQAA